jgi:hypothetical protein
VIEWLARVEHELEALQDSWFELMQFKWKTEWVAERRN